MNTTTDQPYPRSWVLALSCGCHKRQLRAEPFLCGEQLHCTVHNRIVSVSMVDAEYKTRCLTCRGGRKHFGLAKFEAQRFADKHHRKFPDHSIQVLHGDDVVEIRVKRRGMEFLPDRVDDPPF